MNDVVVLLALLGLFLFLRVPIAFALLLASVSVFVLKGQFDLWLVSQQMFEALNLYSLLAVPLFILAGYIMNEAKVTDALIDLACALVGKVRGGLGMVNVAVSMGFAGVSGSATADTGAIGSVLIPQMERRGYSKDFSVAVTAASSVIGIVIPPSVVLVIWGAITNTSVGALLLGGIIPGVLMGLAMMLVVHVSARRNNFPTEEKLSMRELGQAFRRSILALGIPVFVIGGIVSGLVTPTESAVVAVIYALVLGVVVYRTIPLRNIPGIFREAGRLSSLSLFAVAAASVFGYLLSYYRVPHMLQDAMSSIPAGLTLPAIVIVFLLLGTILDGLAVMIILVPVFAPMAAAAGLDPVHYGVVVIVGLSIGLITPPYGLCLLLASSIGDLPVRAASKAVLPFIAILIAILALVMLVPELTLWIPNALM